jgi:hypothetical protein
MTGKVQGQDGAAAVLGGGRLPERVRRWTPYVFQTKGTYRNRWECGPNFKNPGRRPSVQDENYRHHFPLNSIVVESIDLRTAWREISPTFLEALLVQSYLSETGSLPLGNQVL